MFFLSLQQLPVDVILVHHAATCTTNKPVSHDKASDWLKTRLLSCVEPRDTSCFPGRSSPGGWELIWDTHPPPPSPNSPSAGLGLPDKTRLLALLGQLLQGHFKDDTLNIQTRCERTCVRMQPECCHAMFLYLHSVGYVFAADHVCKCRKCEHILST